MNISNYLIRTILEFDVLAHTYIQNSIDNSSFIHDFLMFFTYLGNPIPSLFISITIILFLVLSKRYREIKIFSITVIIAVLIIGILKELIMRARPEGLFEVISYSFPSGHALIVAVCIPLFVYFFKSYFKNIFLRSSFITIAYSYVFIMAYTRIYFGVHYISDIIGGLLIGFGISAVSILIMKNKKTKAFTK